MKERPIHRGPPVARVTCHCGTTPFVATGYKREFSVNERVRSLAQVKNDGTYPHQDIGEIVVKVGDTGYVRETWSFLGKLYYTVEFVESAIVVIMTGRELAAADGLVSDRGERPAR
ncbi:MAG TPA: nitrogen fixation protein NifZ [Pseudolabrys sp.]|nr:nitrogen fixation protein NifZ [Pseudolabrys sp.]